MIIDELINDEKERNEERERERERERSSEEWWIPLSLYYV